MSAVAAFARLGIAPTKDVRSVKRAYALALKAIDQASEREAFERLREAYEQALAWAATGGADEQDEQDEEKEEDQEDQEDRERDSHRRAPEQAPALPPMAPHDLHPPPSSPALPEAPSVAPDRDGARQALQHWTQQLRDAAPESVARCFEATLADPRLLHLDSHAQLEVRIADLLHNDPAGRAELFDVAAAHFRWTDRNARPIADLDAAQWIFRVVNQGLQWRGQAPKVIELQRQALEAVTAVPLPQPEQTRRFGEVLNAMAHDIPDWFVLHLTKPGHVHLPQWQASLKQLGPRWTRQAERKERFFGTRHKTFNTLLGGFVALLLVTAMLAGVVYRLFGDATPAAAVASDTPAAGMVADADPVLAYEFTGAVTRDSCESAEEFVHASNWLETDDADAIALLTTRAVRCQEKGWWSRKNDPLMACLRAERSAALGAGRAENARRCR